MGGTSSAGYLGINLAESAEIPAYIISGLDDRYGRSNRGRASSGGPKLIGDFAFTPYRQQQSRR